MADFFLTFPLSPFFLGNRNIEEEEGEGEGEEERSVVKYVLLMKGKKKAGRGELRWRKGGEAFQVCVCVLGRGSE